MTATPTSDTDLREQLAAEQALNELLVEESTAALELAAEDREWRVASLTLEQEFTRTGLARVVENCTVMAIASPMIKRGVKLRTAYVWGQGVSVQARTKQKQQGKAAGAGQDVNGVVQAFWDDPANQRAFTSAEACEQNEFTVATAGNFLLAFFTDPQNGRVQLRTVPFAEVTDKYTDPDDRDTDWLFLREYTETIVEPGTLPGTLRRRRQTRRVFHPALNWTPPQGFGRPTTIDNIPVEWDVPILHVSVNRPDGWTWGVPDVYASLPWARAYEGFLTDWARLVKALSKFAWRLTGDKGSRVQKAVDKIRTSLPLPPVDLPPLNGSNAGQVAAMGPGANLEAIPKSGATIDSESGRPLAAMAAAGLGVSVVSLLTDPGVTGARAVAETLDKPEVLEMGMRQKLWQSVIGKVLAYVIEQAVDAPQGPLQGSVDVDEFGSRVIRLDGEDAAPDVEVVFPALDELDPAKLVEAIVSASTTEVLPPPWVAKALLRALGEQDVDEVLDPFLDEEGNWIDPRANAGQAAVDRARRGEDPAQGFR